MELVAAKSN